MVTAYEFKASLSYKGRHCLSLLCPLRILLLFSQMN